MAHIAKMAGVSRQAVYLHFNNRAELLIATTRYIDQVKNINERLEPSRTAKTGADRLEKFITAWVAYIPEVYGVARALRAMKDSDEAARDAWNDRMHAMREGCEAAVKALKRDGVLKKGYSLRKATDILWTSLSIQNWEQLVFECQWNQKQCLEFMLSTAKQMLIEEP